MGIASRGRAERAFARLQQLSLCSSNGTRGRMQIALGRRRLRKRFVRLRTGVPIDRAWSKMAHTLMDIGMDGPRRDGNGRRSLSQNTTWHLQHLHHPFFLDGWEDLPGPDPASCRIESGRAGALIRSRRRSGSCFSHCPEIRVTFPESRTASQAAARSLALARSRPTRLTEHEIQ